MFKKTPVFPVFILAAASSGCSAEINDGALIEDAYETPSLDDEQLEAERIADKERLSGVSSEQPREVEGWVDSAEAEHEADAFDSATSSPASGSHVATSKQALSAEAFRVMTLNIRYDVATSHGLERWSDRRDRVYALIRRINADVIGLQEVEAHTWDDISDEFSDYHRWYRGRGGLTNPDEGVALLVRGSRFHYPGSTSYEKTYTIVDQTTRCASNDGIDRNIMRIKVVDKVTDRTLDIFNTHFPSSGTCKQKGMAKKVGNWVEDYGDNILLMGDFNTGWNSSGNMHEPMAFLYEKSSVDLDDVIRTEYGRSFRSTDSIITDKADRPERRFGSMIDHIMMGPAFVLEDAQIDRTLFSGHVPVTCDGANMQVDSSGDRDACRVFGGWVPVENMDSYSDHWAVWADMRRIDCPDGC